MKRFRFQQEPVTLLDDIMFYVMVVGFIALSVVTLLEKYNVISFE